jgi:hypothetical protein
MASGLKECASLGLADDEFFVARRDFAGNRRRMHLPGLLGIRS